MRLVSNFNYLSSTLVTIVVICVLSACSEQRRTTVVNYPINKAFVYNNKIEIAGTGSKDEKKQLTTEGNVHYGSYNGLVSSAQTTSMFNTPFFINSIVEGVSKFRNNDLNPYTVPAYLFINSLPLATLREQKN